MPPSHRSFPSALLATFGSLLLATVPLAAQQKTAEEREWEAHLAGLPEEMATRFQKVVMPTLVEAGSNDQVFDEAVKAYTDWVRELILKGIELDAPSVELAQVALGKAYRNAILARSKYCFQRNDPSEVVIMQGLLRAADALTLQTDITTEALDELMAKCLRFELIFTSDIQLEGMPGAQRHVVKATVPLVRDKTSNEGTLPLLRGSGPIDYVLFDFEMPALRCPIRTSTESGQATVHKLQYTMKRDSAKVEAKFSDVELWLDPGRPTETVTVCDIVDTQSRWFTFFQMLHLLEQTREPGQTYFVFKDWKVLGAGRVFATKEVTEPTTAAAPNSEQVQQRVDGRMRLELRHKPVWR